MIRILHVLTILNRGGLETMLMNYYRKIDRSKVQFDFLVHREERGDYEDEIKMLGGEIYRMPPITPRSIIGYNNRMKNFLLEHGQYKIIHSHIDTLSSLPLKAAMEVNIPVRIAHCHTISVNKDLKAPVRILLKRSVTKYANHYFACSQKAGIWFFGRKNQNQVRVLNNAIDVLKYVYNAEISEGIKSELGLKNKWVIGHVGNFTKPKNHLFLIDVFYEISRLNNDARLLLVGDGELRASIENKINSTGLKDKVILLGFRSDIPKLLQAVDLFLFPSIYEGLGVSLIEAQASGLPCIASDRVPEEVRLTNNIVFLALEDGPKKWASKSMAYFGGFERKNSDPEIIDSGYDSGHSARKLQEFYMESV